MAIDQQVASIEAEASSAIAAASDEAALEGITGPVRVRARWWV